MSEPVRNPSLGDYIEALTKEGMSPEEMYAVLQPDLEHLSVAIKPESFSERAAQRWENVKKLENGHKVNAGINGACALMSAYGALSAASNSISHDETGKSHIIWSQVGVALLQATVAVGCGFFAIESLKGHSVF